MDGNIKVTIRDTPVKYCLKYGEMELFEVLVKSPRVDLNILDDAGDAPIIWCLKIEETEDLKILLDCPLVKLCSSLLPKTSCL